MEDEKLFKLSNGNYLFIQVSSEGGWDYYYLSGRTHKCIDGGILETDEYDEIDDTLIREILDVCGEYTPYEQELKHVAWVEETELTFWDDFED